MTSPGDAPGHQKYQQLLRIAAAEPAVRMAVVHPCDEVALQGAVEAARLRLIVPVLVGPAERIRHVAAEHHLDISGFELVGTAHSHESASRAVALVTAGQAEALMKGSLHTDELMAAVVAREGGLRTGRRVSHCFVMDVLTHPEALIITDAAVNIAPTSMRRSTSRRMRSTSPMRLESKRCASRC